MKSCITTEILPRLCTTTQDMKTSTNESSTGRFDRERRRFEAQLPEELKEQVLASLRSGVPNNRILTTHSAQVMKLVAAGVPPECCHFLKEWDIRNVAKEPRKTEYQKHDNDAESVKLWVQANAKDVFYFQELKSSPVTTTLTAENVPFVIDIQFQFQFRMMLEHRHESIVSMDATFGTNHHRVSSC